MPKFAANLTMLYNEYAFLERFAAARADGFEAVEFLFPYAFPKEQVAERLRKHGLKQVLHNLPAGNWDAGERGIACLPGRTGEFQDGVGRAIEYATALACPQVNCLTGISPAEADADRVRAILVDNLKFAANKLDVAGIRLLIEPINDKDIPGFWLNYADQAVALINPGFLAELCGPGSRAHRRTRLGQRVSAIRPVSPAEDERRARRHVPAAERSDRAHSGCG